MQRRAIARLWPAARPSWPAAGDGARASSSASAPPAGAGGVQWVFLGPPGVGKGTYASRVAKALGVPHIAAGDLVRAEIKSGSALGERMKATVAAGGLLPDEMVLAVLAGRLAGRAAAGEAGFLLDGFPRTRAQAEALAAAGHRVDLAVNLGLREEVLVAKCTARRTCGKCGKGFNLADIRLPASGGRPEILMPPLSPPDKCLPLMEQRDDDTEAVVRRRLAVYHAEAAPVERFYADSGRLLDFEITGGIPETLPRLLDALRPHAGGRLPA